MPFSDQEISTVLKTILFSTNGNVLTMHMSSKPAVTPENRIWMFIGIPYCK